MLLPGESKSTLIFGLRLIPRYTHTQHSALYDQAVQIIIDFNTH